MLRKLSVIVFLTLFLFSIPAMAKMASVNSASVNPFAGKLNLFDESQDNTFNMTGGKVYLGASLSNTVGNSREMFGGYTIFRDRQHYTTMGRQIVYGGYSSAACDNVYMNWSDEQINGGYNVHFAIYQWDTGSWDNTVVNGANVAPGSANTCNIDVTPGDGFPVHSYHHGADQQPYYSHVSYGALCADYAVVTDTVPGSSVSTFDTGYNGDDLNQSYVWPNLSVGLNASGQLVTHVASYEAAGGAATPGDGIEVSSLVYERKVANSPTTPWTGTWDAPVLIDTAYTFPLVTAVPNSDSVFYVYMKPLYYFSDIPSNPHYCTNGLGHYQITNNVAYKLSTDNGQTWGSTQLITDYGANFETGGADPATYDISALVDEDHNLHVVWSGSKRDPEDPCVTYYAGQMWHWDSDNNCISLAYDASEPALFPGGTDFGAWNIVISKMNVSVCDGKLYIAFTRFGNEYYVNTDGDKVATMDFGVNDGTSPFFMNGDILVVVSETGGQTWSDGVNLTDTQTDTCVAGDCDSEHWPSMAMYMNDSLMISYIYDRDPGAEGNNDEGTVETENPVMFMTWPCFTLADVGTKTTYTTSPTDPTWTVPLKPQGETDCTTTDTWSGSVLIQNTGNVNQNYTSVSDAAWLSITSGGAGALDAGVGPRGTEDWTNGIDGCASPATIEFTANSSTLSEGLYTGTITVTFDAGADPLDIEVNALVACKYFEPEYATLQGGCWEVAAWNIPFAGLGLESVEGSGNMKFYACNFPTDPNADYYAPMFNESFLVGWNDGTVEVWGDMIGDAYERGFRALDSITVTEVGTPASGQGYYKTSGMWAAGADSCIKGTIEYIVPGHQDTALLIERITVWNECATKTGFVLGEAIDWDIRADSAGDEGGLDFANGMVYQTGTSALYENCAGGVYVYSGGDGNIGATVLDNNDYIYPNSGYDPDSAYNVMTRIDGNLSLDYDTAGDLNSLYRFWEGDLSSGTTLEVIKIKGVSCDGTAGLTDLLVTKGSDFLVNNDPFAGSCQGLCGDANNDSSVDVSDAVYIINYAFAGGTPPQPVIACGDANSDGSPDVSDAVYIINFAFAGGTPPGDCAAGSWGGDDCCAY